MKQILKNLSKMKKYILLTLIISMLLIAVPLSTTIAADDGGGGGGGDGDISSDGLNITNPLGATSDITTLVENILNFLWKLAWAVAPILIVYAGFLYITSAGNEDKVKTAQKTLVWALVGFAVVLIASSVPAIIKDFLGEEESSEIGEGGEAGAGIGVEGEINLETEEETTTSEGEETAEEETVEEEKSFVKICSIGI